MVADELENALGVLAQGGCKVLWFHVGQVQCPRHRQLEEIRGRPFHSRSPLADRRNVVLLDGKRFLGQTEGPGEKDAQSQEE